MRTRRSDLPSSRLHGHFQGKSNGPDHSTLLLFSSSNSVNMAAANMEGGKDDLGKSQWQQLTLSLLKVESSRATSASQSCALPALSSGAMVAHTSDPSAQEAEAEQSPEVGGQPCLQSELQDNKATQRNPSAPPKQPNQTKHKNSENTRN